ncbi:MAG: NAD(P)H-binding protein [Anaerolineales bacterium]
MVLKRTVAVTGAFSYSGSYIAGAFLKRGWEVITFTRRPDRPHPLSEKVKAYALDFSKPEQISERLHGVDTFVNTYWVRYNYPGSSFDLAVENSRILIGAVGAAGVRRFVHISVSKPDINSQLPYFRGKQKVEDLITNGKLSYSILRPTIVYADEEVLINNITWLVSHFPVFPIPGDGQYRVQPIYAEDLAQQVVRSAEGKNNEILDAAGPEIFTFNELLQLLKKISGSKVWLFHTPTSSALLMAKVVSFILGDVMLTKDELTALIEERLVTGMPALGTTRFSDWAREHAQTLGDHYVNELKRHHGKETKI